VNDPRVYLFDTAFAEANLCTVPDDLINEDIMVITSQTAADSRGECLIRYDLFDRWVILVHRSLQICRRQVIVGSRFNTISGYFAIFARAIR
jgi:hypothetical protein